MAGCRLIYSIMCVLVLVAMLASPCGAGADLAEVPDTLWPALRGTAEGRATCQWPASMSPPNVREWHFQSKSRRRYRPGLAVWASPAIALVGGRPMAFLGGYDQALHALDLVDKERKWFKITNGAIGAAPAVGQVNGRTVVFWGSADRTVYAHFALNGTRLWTRELVKPTNTMGEAEVSSPLLHDSKLYITCFVYDRALARNDQKGWLFALDMASGRVVWQLEATQGPLSSPVGREMDGRFVVFVAARRGLLQAFDVSGEQPTRLWSYQMPHEVLGSPAVEEGTERPLLFLGSKFGNLVALDARTGEERWKRMAGNWIDNSACIGMLEGERVVFVGSHDYNVYAFRAADGALLWRRHLGGEVYSAPAFFFKGEPMLAVAALDNRVYVLNAKSGKVVTSYYTGRPIWDKVAKGETLWGSPAILAAGEQTAIVHGSFNDWVYVLPVTGECTLRAQVQSAAGLWYGLGIVLVLFLGIVMPILLILSRRNTDPAPTA